VAVGKARLAALLRLAPKNPCHYVDTGLHCFPLAASGRSFATTPASNNIAPNVQTIAAPVGMLN
jgi:hypothetical protein